MKKLFANTNRIPFVYDSCCNRNNKGINSMLILLVPSIASGTRGFPCVKAISCASKLRQDVSIRFPGHILWSTLGYANINWTILQYYIVIIIIIYKWGLCVYHIIVCITLYIYICGIIICLACILSY